MRSLFLFIGLLVLGMISYNYAYEGYRAKDISWDKDVTIENLDGKIMTGAEFCEEFVTSYEYNPKTDKFDEHKCRQERLADKKFRLAEKKHHHHGGANESYHRARTPEVWLQCKQCGKVCKGWHQADLHVDATGHTKFQRMFFN